MSWEGGKKGIEARSGWCYESGKVGRKGKEDRKNRGRGEDEEEEDEDSRDEGARTSAHANRTHAESHRIRAFLGKMSRFMLVKMAPDRSAGGLGSRNSRKRAATWAAGQEPPLE